MVRIWNIIQALLTEMEVLKDIYMEPEVRSEFCIKSNRIAKGVIVEYLADSFLGFARDDSTAREILIKFDDLYERKSLASQLALRKKLLGLKLKGDTTSVQHFTNFEDLITE